MHRIQEMDRRRTEIICYRYIEIIEYYNKKEYSMNTMTISHFFLHFCLFLVKEGKGRGGRRRNEFSSCVLRPIMPSSSLISLTFLSWWIPIARIIWHGIPIRNANMRSTGNYRRLQYPDILSLYIYRREYKK